MRLETKFSLNELEAINRQALIYMCCCPAQVSSQIVELRRLFDYQNQCLSSQDSSELQADVHRRIGVACQQAHAVMEQCLDDILTMEGWDRQTLEMPAGIRQQIEKTINE